MALGGRWLCAGALLLAASGAARAEELGLPGSASRGVVLEPSALPEGKSQTGEFLGEKGAGIRAGTAGLPLPGGRKSAGGLTLAVLGDLAPADARERDKYLKMAVEELNILRPELVLTVGNLVPGLTRNATRYTQEATHVRSMLDTLKMPWYPCAGETDVVSGVRPGDLLGPAPATDRRFETFYQRLMGPLYYSVDAGGGGGVHAIVLDSQEHGTISEAQYRWLREDLNRTFEASMAGTGPRWVVVTVHRPLWRDAGKPGGDPWKRIHDLLVAFNRRPVAAIEGIGPAGGGSGGGVVMEARGPRVVAVFAGGERAYSLEPLRDGIQYFVMGPTAALPHEGLEVSQTLRHMLLIKFDPNIPAGAAATAAMYPALIQLGPVQGDAGAIAAADAMTLRERSVIDAIAGWGEDVIGIDGLMDDRGNAMGQGLSLHVSNPLAEPVDVLFRLAAASASNNGPAVTPWELRTIQPERHLAPGAKAALAFSLVRSAEFSGPPPLAEIAVRWTDPRASAGKARVHEVVLRRRLVRVPTAELSLTPKTLALDSALEDPYAGIACAWPPLRNDAPARGDPTFDLAADGQHLLVRVHVEDPLKSYWPVMRLDAAHGGLASDAVSVAWARGPADKPLIERVWVVPFAPRGAGAAAGGGTAAELWTNTGMDDKQTELLRLDPRSGIQAAVTADGAGYTVTLLLPRKLVCEETAPLAPPATLPATTPQSPINVASARLNITVHDNNETLRTWSKSWCREDAGPAAWARIELIQPASAVGAAR